MDVSHDHTQSQRARVGVGEGATRKGQCLTQGSVRDPWLWSVSSLVKWILFCRFLSPVVKMKDCKAKTNLAVGEENPGLEVELDVFLQS